MKIKAFLRSGRFKIFKVINIKEMRLITKNYTRWEYIL